MTFSPDLCVSIIAGDQEGLMCLVLYQMEACQGQIEQSQAVTITVPALQRWRLCQAH